MKRTIILGGIIAAIGIATIVYIPRPAPETRPWKSTDVWYHESDVASLGTSGRPQLVEFFHPD